jgi:uncharacterized lipoprotein YmbA
MNKLTSMIAVLSVATSLLSACAGGNDVAAVVPDTLPVGATASPEAYTQFAATQPEDDLREPLKLDDVVPPTSETTEPEPVAR